MKFVTQTVLILLAVLLIAADKQGEKGKSDKEKLQGTWKIVSAEFDGKPLKEAIGGTMTFTGDRIEQGKKGDKEYYEGKYELDPSKNPKHIDLTHAKAKIMAIYSLDGDELRISSFRTPDGGKKRPSVFASKAGEMQMVLVFKRVK